MCHVESSRLTPDLVRCLLREQFPQWAVEHISAVDVQGWDNRTFRVSDDLLARLPSAEGYAAAVAKEHRWLPYLQSNLDLPIPAPVALGRPGCGLPWPWSVYRWRPGTSARTDLLIDAVSFARDVAGFLTALHAVDVDSGPTPGAHNGWRGGPVTTYDAETRATAASLADDLDLPAVLEVWQAAVAAPFDEPPRWVHGDVTGSNLLVEDGRLSAVIDFGSCAVGDPACDLVIAWTFFDGEARATFREAVPVEPGTWARARGWALWKGLLTMAAGPDAAAAERRYGWRCSARRLVDELIIDHREGRGWHSKPA